MVIDTIINMCKSYCDQKPHCEDILTKNRITLFKLWGNVLKEETQCRTTQRHCYYFYNRQAYPTMASLGIERGPSVCKIDVISIYTTKCCEAILLLSLYFSIPDHAHDIVCRMESLCTNWHDRTLHQDALVAKDELTLFTLSLWTVFKLRHARKKGREEA